MTKNAREPMKRTQTAARPVDLYTAPIKRIWSILRTSVVALAMNAAANTAKVAAIAGSISPMKRENTIMADAMKNTDARGKPVRLAKTEARVCSSQVTGNQ